MQFIEGFSCIVYPFIDAENGFDCTFTDEQWVILGRALRRIHEIEVPLSIQSRLRRESYCSKYRESLRNIYQQIELKSVSDAIAIEMSSFMKTRKSVILHLVERAQTLADFIKSNHEKSVLCHSDIHAGNVLKSTDNALYIIDWDEPIMAPKERDLMFIGGGVGNVWNKPYEEALFYTGYGKTDINKTLLAYYRHERIVEDIAIYSQELILTDLGGENRAQMLKHFMDMFDPDGVVDLAFKTDNID